MVLNIDTHVILAHLHVGSKYGQCTEGFVNKCPTLVNVLFILNHVRTTPYTLQRNQHFQCFTVNSSQHQLNVYVHSKLLYYIL